MQITLDWTSRDVAFLLAQDILRELAVNEGPLMVGTCYWAKQALTSVLSSILARSMQQLLQHPEVARDKPEMGALLVVNNLCHAWPAML